MTRLSTTEQLRAKLGALKPDTDPRLDRPIVDQFEQLVDWATNPIPGNFRRSVPVKWNDHDILICNVLAKLVGRIEELERQINGGEPNDG